MVEQQEIVEIKADYSALELKQNLKSGAACLVQIDLTGDTWKKFGYARFQSETFKKYCFCRKCYTSITMHDSKGNSFICLVFCLNELVLNMLFYQKLLNFIKFYLLKEESLACPHAKSILNCVIRMTLKPLSNMQKSILGKKS